jgi:hypothetical protein
MQNTKPALNGNPKLLPRERRAFRRFPLPPGFQLEARWNGTTLALEPPAGEEAISGGGACLALAAAAPGLADSRVPPVDAELEICFPLVSRPFQFGRVYARCRARVLRHDGPRRVAVRFQEVIFEREERASSLPLPLPAEN